jgi:hypothetical protein
MGATHKSVPSTSGAGWALVGLLAGLTRWRWRVFRRPERGVGREYLAGDAANFLLRCFGNPDVSLSPSRQGGGAGERVARSTFPPTPVRTPP